MALIPALAKALPDDITFPGDWSQPPHAGTPNAWAHLQTWKPDRITASNGIATIKVHPGDKVGGWSGERAEVSQMQDARGADYPVTAQSGHEFYGIAVKLAPDWQAPAVDPDAHAAWGIVLQLHGPDNLHASPAIALCAEKDFHLDLDAGDLLKGGRVMPKGVRHYAFSYGTLDKGQWVDFVLDVHWASDNTGSITVYRRNRHPERSEGSPSWDETLHSVQGDDDGGWKKVLTLTHIPTLQYAGNAPGPHYWKAGFYRSASPFISTLSLGPVVRGKSFAAVAKLLYFP